MECEATFGAGGDDSREEVFEYPVGLGVDCFSADGDIANWLSSAFCNDNSSD